MRNRSGALAVAALLAIAGSPGTEARAATRFILRSTIVTPPIPVVGTDHRRHLAYEMLLYNPTRRSVTLNRLDIIDGASGETVSSWRARRLSTMMFAIEGNDVVPTRTLRARSRGLILFDVRLPLDRAAPTFLRHRFTMSRARSPARRVRQEAASTSVSDAAAIEIAPPLAEDDLLTIGCCGPPFQHRFSGAKTAEGFVMAQRYATDIVQLGEGVERYEGDPSDNSSYFIYGDEALAVAEGEVVATRNDMAENTPGSPPPGVGFENAAGNYVTLKVGEDAYAFFAHLQPGSVTVEPGDLVSAGQVLGLIGNSGNSTEPHLHFHFMAGDGGASGLESDGIPYVFDRFELRERVTISDSNPEREPAEEPVERFAEYPLTGDVVSFGSD